eukprot:TRINITY_DN13981_c0_g1_i1.p1 TRINITY_DN13981_c0_g1~~TRINITY_DN13981_c0_g1_i1.p1  ORF type:complete len:476 (-),score=133.73 TRINITY_DN13981_c0_g1_i1:16-1326(-)
MDDGQSDDIDGEEEEQEEVNKRSGTGGGSFVPVVEKQAISRIVAGQPIARNLTMLDSPVLTKHLMNIDSWSSSSSAVAAVGAEDRYDAINASNELISAIDADVVAVHKRLRDLYSARFPELEQLLPNPVDFAKVVKAIASNTDLRNVPLSEIIPSNAVLVVQMTFTTTSGKPLAEETMSEVLELCDLVLDLHEAKNKIFVYIEEQMSLLAPNVSALVGTHIAARLIGLVGGLEALSRMPGCNVMIIGSVENKMATGLVSFGSKHRGIVFQSDLVQSAPSDLQRKILKIVSSKIVLAARVDVSKETDLSSSSEFKGEVGLKFRGDIEKKIIKMQEPPPKKQKKALPIPLEKPRKKRGGAKYRRMKERFQITDLQKQKNRMAFNRADDDDYGGEIEMGLLGSADSGRVRIAAQDTQRLSKGLWFHFSFHFSKSSIFSR